MREKDFSKIETNNNICINVFCNEYKPTFPISISDQEFKNSMNVLLTMNENKSHYVYMKDLCFTKGRIKTKNTFAKVV